MRIPFVFGVMLALSGCFAGEPLRYVVEPIIATERVRTTADTISIAEVSLPAYAKEPKIFVEGSENALVPLTNADWGDEPERALTQTLVRHLTEISGAEVASEPWPLGGVPEAEVRVRVSRMVVTNEGVLRMAGHFSVRRDVQTSRNAIELFSVEAPVAAAGPDGTPDPAAIVQAHAAAWRDLASVIAREI